MRKIYFIHPGIHKETHFFPKGFSLVETLIALSLSSLILLFSFEIFSSTQKHFFKLKQEEENCTAAYAALDKMRIDISRGGWGLLQPLKMDVLEGITKDRGTLTIFSRKMNLFLSSDLKSGQTKIHLKGALQKIKKGQKLCIHDTIHGEIKDTSSIHPESVILDSPLNHSYSHVHTSVILLRQVSLFLDKKRNILRRKVNTAPAQPLLEKVSTFDFQYEKETNLLILALSFKQKGEKRYETTLFPKNTAMAQL
ncbi:prepilin-type N-terminal cleavage/methylation domain-containing protein [bacterium]|nr:prepilin-type N-terminal cleavage/methylation domain-containing protein [bacterium]